MQLIKTLLFVLVVCASSVHCRNYRKSGDQDLPDHRLKKRHQPKHDSEEAAEEMAALHDDKHGIKMGIPSQMCDNGRLNITIDWDLSPVNYTCQEKTDYVPDPDLPALLETEDVPYHYMASHVCYPHEIKYDRPLPTFGNHRPLWPKYGQYKFLPMQRWLHSVEHGAIVMLYHPCADPEEVNKLRKLVFTCLRRHVITPYTMLEEKRPLALLAWGVRLTMSTVNPEIVRAFLREKSKNGMEGYDARQGQYDFMLEVASVVPAGSDFEDSVVCPYQ